MRPDLCGPRVLVMEWIDGVRCTNPAGIRASGLDLSQFIRCGVVSGLRQLLEVRARSVWLGCHLFTVCGLHPCKLLFTCVAWPYRNPSLAGSAVCAR